MAKTVCKILGVVFVIVGVAGFAAPTLLGAHLNQTSRRMARRYTTGSRIQSSELVSSER